MDNSTFYSQLHLWMCTGASQLEKVIPQGNLIFRIANAPADVYQTGFVSTNVGQFKRLGESGNWYASNFKTCSLEVESTGNSVYEVLQITANIPILDMNRLPVEFRKAMKDDCELRSGSYEKSHLALLLASSYLPWGSYSGICFPSRRDEEGQAFVYDPSVVPVEFKYTGQCPPSGIL